MAQNGNNILLYRGTTLVGGMKSNDIQTDADVVEISSPGSGSWKYYITGRKSATLQVGYLVLSDSALGVSGGNGVRDLLEVGNEFSLVFKVRGASDSEGVSGSFILKTCKISSVRGNLVTGSFQFVLNGALT
jgi:hypothetical protein